MYFCSEEDEEALGLGGIQMFILFLNYTGVYGITESIHKGRYLKKIYSICVSPVRERMDAYVGGLDSAPKRLLQNNHTTTLCLPCHLNTFRDSFFFK